MSNLTLHKSGKHKITRTKKMPYLHPSNSPKLTFSPKTQAYVVATSRITEDPLDCFPIIFIKTNKKKKNC